MNPMSKEERAGTGVVELAAVVALDRLDSGAILGGHMSKEVSERGKCVRLKLQWERP